MKLISFTLPDTARGHLYPAIRKMQPLLPDRCIRDAFQRKDVKMNGLRASRDAEIMPGATIKLYITDECAIPSPVIIYEDQRLMIVHKPVGVSSEADGSGGLTAGAWLMQQMGDRLSREPVPCHRLDNQTDGLLILAKDEQTQALMAAAFRKRQVHKKYTCLVRGTPEPAEAVLEAFLVKDAAAAKVFVHDDAIAGALPIRTGYRVITGGDVSRLEITLFTGRTHQIRAQMAHIGHPLLGDDKYGDRAFNKLHHARRLMLTATELTFDTDADLAYLNGMRLTLPPGF